MGGGCSHPGGLTAVPLWPQVAVVRQRDSGQIFAMKMLHKWEMLKRAEVSLGPGGTSAPYSWARGVVACEAVGHAEEGTGVVARQAEDPRSVAARSPHPFLAISLS